ncbi:ribonuclease P protein component [Sorangium cellulosum]|uniref:ribonuclease P protein component n=1 Tax=Sorangium cellulosum TaxID=56 RepID=UPI0009D6E0B9|nr:ribonuclease P protein component [Sorangium cellulosum]
MTTPARQRSSASASFPRVRRIRKRADFVRIQNGGHRVTTRHLLILVAAPTAATPRGAARRGKERSAALSESGAAAAPPSPGAASRLGLVASRKVGGAVARNRAKRLLREAFRKFPELFPDHVDIVVILRTGAGSLGLEDVLAELRSVVPVVRRRARDALAAAPPIAAAARDADERAEANPALPARG